MPIFEEFAGINNVAPSHRLLPNELQAATDVDIGLTGEISRRAGYVQTSQLCHKNLHEFGASMLVTSSSDLVGVSALGVRTTIYPSLGMSRVWYLDLPDGRVAFGNGLICGITDGLVATGWGVPVPTSVGSPTDIQGQLFAGDYQWVLSYVRLSDNLEGGAYPSAAPTRFNLGGIMLTGLPALAGYKINVYLSSHNGGEAYLAGSTTGTTFAYTGANDALVLPCRTEYMGPAPETGTISAMWRGRALVADGAVLRASLPLLPELFDLRRDFKQFSAAITLIQPVDDGVYVGTEQELVFLRGVGFDELSVHHVMPGNVVLGSGVSVQGQFIKPPKAQAPGEGLAMLCIVDKRIIAGFSGGVIGEMTTGRYETAATEVAATFRRLNGVPQYIAIPQ